jgi:hypothetical protein
VFRKYAFVYQPVSGRAKILPTQGGGMSILNALPVRQKNKKGPAIYGQPFLCQQKENDILLIGFYNFIPVFIL